MKTLEIKAVIRDNKIIYESKGKNVSIKEIIDILNFIKHEELRKFIKG
jgi:hypothetical protein